jgi:hypothetical protein
MLMMSLKGWLERLIVKKCCMMATRNQSRDISLAGKKIIGLGLPQSDTDASTEGEITSVWASAVGVLNNSHYEFGLVVRSGT